MIQRFVLLSSAALTLLSFTVPARAQCPLGEFLPTGAGPSDLFGRSVDVSGDVLAVGAPLDDTAGANAGAVYVFERVPGGWTQTAKLTVPGSTWLGVDVSVSGDAILAGATPGPDGIQQNDAAYVFERTGGAWSLAATFVPPNPFPNDMFGWSVSLSGSLAVVGRPFAPAPVAGEAYVYEKVGGVWGQTAVFQFVGRAVSTDGQRILAGHSSGASVFERVGGTWAYVESLPSSTPFTLSPTQDVFIAGDLAFLAAEQSDSIGAVRVFERTPGGWMPTAVLESKSLFGSEYHGRDLSYSNGVLLVASPFYYSAPLAYRQHGSAWVPAFEFEVPPGAGAIGYAAQIDGATIALTKDGASVFAYELGTGLSLFGCPQTISLSAGGSQSLELDAAPAHAGQIYVLVGSTSGTAPGIPIDGWIVPLNPDAYLSFTLASPNQPPLSGSLGTLDGAGEAQAAWSIPPGTDPALIGTVLHHAYAVFDLALPGVVFTSAPAPLVLSS